jgi:hypothetical protein
LRSAIVRVDPHFRLLPSWRSIAYKLAIAIAVILTMCSIIAITTVKSRALGAARRFDDLVEQITAHPADAHTIVDTGSSAFVPP